EREPGERDAVAAGQLARVDLVVAPLTVETRTQIAELRDADGRLEVRELEVEADLRMHVVPAGALHRPALVLERTYAPRYRVVVRRDDATLPGRDRLVRRERERARDAEEPQIPAAAPGSERLGGVLDDGDAARGCAPADRGHVGAAPAHMDGHDRARAR